MYLYARELGSNHLASIVAGNRVRFQRVPGSHLKHPSLANAACWLPLALMLLEARGKAEPLSLASLVSELFSGLQQLSGNRTDGLLLWGSYISSTSRFGSSIASVTVRDGSRKPSLFKFRAQPVSRTG